MVAGLLFGTILFFWGIRQVIALAFFTAATFVATVIFVKILRAVISYSREHETNIALAAWKIVTLSNRLICSSLIHAGVVMVMVGIIASSLFTREETFMVREGEVFQMEDYTLTFNGVTQDRDAIKDMLTAEVEVIRGGLITGLLKPQKRFYRNHEQPMTEIALDQSLFQDLYLILYGWDGEGNFSFRVIINPLVGFIWWGVTVMCLAGAWRLLYLLKCSNRKTVSA